MVKCQKNYKTNYNQRKVDRNLEAENNFEITIETTDVTEIITVKNSIRVVTEHQLNSFPKSSNNKLLQIIFKLPISMTIGYNSTMRIQHIKWSRSLYQGDPVPNEDKFWCYLPDQVTGEYITDQIRI